MNERERTKFPNLRNPLHESLGRIASGMKVDEGSLEAIQR